VGSTNVHSEDTSGHPIYSWLILDGTFDIFAQPASDENN